MILNIIDNRKKKYRWRKITAIFEPTCHDDRCNDADITNAEESAYVGIGYHEMSECSLSEAIEFAVVSHSFLTVYLYDLGDGIRVV